MGQGWRPWEHRRVDQQDDPEARIRALERSLSDPAPPSAPSSPRPRKRFRWWPVFTAVASGVLGVVVYFGVNDGLKLIAPGGGVFGSFPEVSIPEPPPAA